MGDLKEQLAKLYPELVTKRPAKHPPYSDLDIPSSYEKFCADLAGGQLKDQRELIVSIEENNFPKLLGMKLAATGKKVKAKIVLAHLRAGTFSPTDYRIDVGRLRTLFWIADVISDCHSIHPNAHAVIEADEVYVKTYDKLGAPIKLIFTITINNVRKVATSFLIDQKDLRKYVAMPALWPKKEGPP
jgi:hypothetical protein